MQTKSVQISCDVHCEWNGSDTRYRLYVNDELFTERSWIWNSKDYYLEEIVTIEAVPGMYNIKYELVQPTHCQLQARNIRVIRGQARLHQDQNTLEIL